MIVYKVTNLINGKIYVGQDTKNRNWYLGSGRVLLNAIKRYGRENFEKVILQECNTQQELDQAEEFWIKELDARSEKGYNISPFARGGNIKNFLPKDRIVEYNKNVSAGLRHYHANKTEEQRKSFTENWRKTFYNKTDEELNQIRHKKSVGSKKVWDERNDSERKSISSKISRTISGRIWYNDGVLEKQVEPDNIPLGWVKGRLKRKK